MFSPNAKNAKDEWHFKKLTFEVWCYFLCSIKTTEQFICCSLLVYITVVKHSISRTYTHTLQGLHKNLYGVNIIYQGKQPTEPTLHQISHILKNMSDMVLGQLTVYCFKMADGCLNLRLVSPGSNWHPVYKTLHNISQQMCIRL